MFERLGPFDPAVELLARKDASMHEFDDAVGVLHHFNSNFGTIDARNQAFISAGRPDLAITTPAKMDTIEDPLTLYRASNSFSSGFRMVDGLSPISPDQVRGLLDGSFQLSEYATGHIRKPAFYRMLLLEANFTAGLVADASVGSAENFHQFEAKTKFLPRLYAAYQIMSELVDLADDSVIAHGPDDIGWYLCR